MSAKWHKTDTSSSEFVPAETSSNSDRESNPHYRAVVAVLNKRWRIVTCRNGIQWILQQRKSSGHGTAWRGRSYCRTKSGLIEACARLAGEIDPSPLAILETLPTRIESGVA